MSSLHPDVWWCTETRGVKSTPRYVTLRGAPRLAVSSLPPDVWHFVVHRDSRCQVYTQICGTSWCTETRGVKSTPRYVALRGAQRLAVSSLHPDMWHFVVHRDSRCQVYTQICGTSWCTETRGVKSTPRYVALRGAQRLAVSSLHPDMWHFVVHRDSRCQVYTQICDTSWCTETRGVKSTPRCVALRGAQRLAVSSLHPDMWHFVVHRDSRCQVYTQICGTSWCTETRGVKSTPRYVALRGAQRLAVSSLHPDVWHFVVHRDSRCQVYTLMCGTSWCTETRGVKSTPRCVALRGAPRLAVSSLPPDVWHFVVHRDSRCQVYTQMCGTSWCTETRGVKSTPRCVALRGAPRLAVSSLPPDVWHFVVHRDSRCQVYTQMCGTSWCTETRGVKSTPRYVALRGAQRLAVSSLHPDMWHFVVHRDSRCQVYP